MVAGDLRFTDPLLCQLSCGGGTRKYSEVKHLRQEARRERIFPSSVVDLMNQGPAYPDDTRQIQILRTGEKYSRATTELVL